MRSLALLLVICVMAACGPSASGTRGASPTPISGPCPVTTRPPVALAPPPTAGTGSNPGLVLSAGPDTFLYGNDALVVLLPNDGTLRPSDPQRGLAGGIKFPWFRTAHGDLTIATRRLDAPTDPVPADVPTGYGDVGLQVSGLSFASTGCWQVTGTIAGKTLAFVVNVAGR